MSSTFRIDTTAKSVTGRSRIALQTSLLLEMRQDGRTSESCRMSSGSFLCVHDYMWDITVGYSHPLSWMMIHVVESSHDPELHNVLSATIHSDCFRLSRPVNVIRDAQVMGPITAIAPIQDSVSSIWLVAFKSVPCLKLCLQSWSNSEL